MTTSSDASFNYHLRAHTAFCDTDLYKKSRPTSLLFYLAIALRSSTQTSRLHGRPSRHFIEIQKCFELNRLPWITLTGAVGLGGLEQWRAGQHCLGGLQRKTDTLVH